MDTLILSLTLTGIVLGLIGLVLTVSLIIILLEEYMCWIIERGMRFLQKWTL